MSSINAPAADTQSAEGPDPVASAKDMASSAGAALKDDAADLASRAKDAAQSQLNEKKGLAAELVEDLAAALHKAGEELGTRERDPAAGLAHRAADGLGGLAHALAEKRPNELVDAVRGFGRENPVAFAAGTALAGFAIGRFLRGSIEPERDSPEPESTSSETQAEFPMGADTASPPPWPSPALEAEVLP